MAEEVQRYDVDTDDAELEAANEAETLEETAALEPRQPDGDDTTLEAAETADLADDVDDDFADLDADLDEANDTEAAVADIDNIAAPDAASDADEAGEIEEAAAAEAAPEDDRSWYVIHCYSGYENKVRHNLEQRIDTMGMKDKIFDVVVPTEEEIEVREGKRRTVERRVFPGYILVQMLMDEDSWYVVRNTPGVTGFVGMGNTPTPLRPEEVNQIMKRMEAESPKVKVTFKIGQKVRIIDGPFNDFIGTVADLDMARAKVRVMVSFFGRETPVELDFLQVEKA